MHSELRRKDRLMNNENTLALLESGEYGVMASVSAVGQPYATPLSYIFDGVNIYFHCAREGHKVENINDNPRVCFTVVGKTKPVYDKGFSTYYESVIVYGKAFQVEEDLERAKILTMLAEKYLPGHLDKVPADLEKYFSATAVYRITIEHITGKAKHPKEL